jgi:Tol biopolymer transport system component
MRRIALLAVCAAAGFLLVQTASTATNPVLAYNDLTGSVFVSSTSGASPTTAFDSSSSAGVITVGISPDGASVLVADGSNLDSVPATGGSPSPISGTDGATSGSFSPDGSTVVFATSGGIYTVPAAGGTPAQIAATPDNAVDSLPTYSPSGTQIAFARDAFDSSFNETTTIELVSSTGGSLTDLSASPFTNAAGGGKLSYSPDGKTIAYATSGGIFTIPVAGGSPHQLTTDDDGSPIYSADGKTIYFARSAYSQNADDQQPSPVHPSSNDVSELWSMNADGSGAAVIQEGDYENLALTTPKSASTSTTKSTTGPTTSRTTTSATTTGVTTTVAAPKATGTVTAITISISGIHYRVAWTGHTSKRWKVTLKVGKKSTVAILAGTARSHTFTVKTKGVVTATVAPSN